MGRNSCRKKGGKPKAAFATEQEANAAIPDHEHYLRAYPCRAGEHGWHIGHDYTLLDLGVIVRTAGNRRHPRRY